MQILVIDEHQDLASLLEQRFAEGDCTLRSTFSSEEGLAAIEADLPLDVVLLNLNTSDREGLNVLQRIKKCNPLVEIIMLTRQADVHTAVEAVKAGAFDYLPKPVQVESLVLKIEQAAQRKRLRADLIQDVYMTPYLTPREKKEKINRILNLCPEADN